ncbi:Uncharacterised protein [Serratia fonticola]|nr:Uncharacterised protein [Serratia fonticola]CAI0991851.1 Uncharacterised protein [Serratia fonticola]CAI1800052.1 Uncharacterised protein [Serratia fonticola]
MGAEAGMLNPLQLGDSLKDDGYRWAQHAAPLRCEPGEGLSAVSDGLHPMSSFMRYARISVRISNVDR